MEIVLGLGLDSRQGPSAQPLFDAATLGPTGLLGVLETHLGLAGPAVSPAQRVAVYLSCLQRAEGVPPGVTHRFYSESLRVDPMGAAERLLAWRDEWRMGGWTGQGGAPAQERLRDLSLVESEAVHELPPGEPERLEAVCHALRAGALVPITRIVLVDDITLWPWLWQVALSLLPGVQQRSLAGQCQVPIGAPAPQLAKVQSHALGLAAGQAPAAPLPPITDHSLLVVKSRSWATAQHWLSERLHQAPADRLILAEDGGDALDDIVEARGGSRCGFSASSPWRPALQCLPLALTLCWAPLDIHALVEFLAHPMGPMPRRIRQQLLRAVHREPGVGGQAWQEVKSRLVGTDDEGQLAGIQEWLEAPRWFRDEGAPIAPLIERTQRMSLALQQRLALAAQQEGGVSVLSAAVQQCDAVVQALMELQSRGTVQVSPRMLEQIIECATPSGVTDPAAVAQVGAVRSASSVEACVEPADEVIWWMPTAPALTQSLPWSVAEQEGLRSMGVHLRNPEHELQALFARWLRPLLAARQRFVLVLPVGEAEAHPITQILEQLVEGFKHQVLDLDAPHTLADQMQPVTHQALPTIPEHLSVADAMELDTQKQSFTSLDELFHAPATYALKRQAKLKATDLPQVGEDRRLLGTLAHRLLEKLFAHPDALQWGPDQLEVWVRPAMEDLISQEGAVLLMQGGGVNLARFRARCVQALRSLLRVLQDAGVTRVETEVQVAGSLWGVQLQGSVDLLLHLPDGGTVALDTKWHGDKRYAKAFQDGEFLQLAIYSALLQAQTGQPPRALGYFVFNSATIYINQPDLLPGAVVKSAAPGQGSDALLAQAQATWAWRQDQFAAGQVDVPPPKPDAAWQGPEGTFAVKGPKPWDQEFLVALGGWQ